MGDLLDGLTRYLAGRGYGTYRPDSVYDANEVALTLDYLPSTPDRAIALTGYGGATVQSGQSVDEPRVQLRVRGVPGDPTWPRTRALALHDALHGLARVALPNDGPWLVLAVAQGRPESMGRDDNNRHEHVVNVACSITNPQRIGR
ncbi:minor capsid protein [Actinopolyspora halophila]|uniref:minor capsid protein n=1 Tax=Actinopolyspora halophila TaxID=1850 RepID=UPI000377A953|nr:minor capsid protein [Actinopolyspora halophila]